MPYTPSAAVRVSVVTVTPSVHWIFAGDVDYVAAAVLHLHGEPGCRDLLHVRQARAMAEALGAGPRRRLTWPCMYRPAASTAAPDGRAE
jgi:hypothetical protein